jgi:hypothetical protein
LIQRCKLPEIPDRYCVVRQRCFTNINEATPVYFFPINFYLSTPLVSAGTPDNATVSGCVVGVKIFTIPSVLGCCCEPKIRASVVERASIYVIHPWNSGRVYYSQNVTLYGDVSRSPTVFPKNPVSYGVKFSSNWVPARAPIPLSQGLVVTEVYDHVLTESERNESDRLVLRLDNSVSFNVALHCST